MNWGYLAAARNALKNKSFLPKNKLSKNEKKHFRINLLKLSLTLSFLFLFSVWLMKIYEVPVYETDINIWDMGWENDKCPQTHLTIRITRDYGRNNNFADLKTKKDTNNIFRPGVEVYGQLYHNPNKPGWTFHSLNAPILEDSIQKIIDRNMSLDNYEDLKTYEDFKTNVKVAYVSIAGTSRQEAYLRRTSPKPKVDFIKPDYYYGMYNWNQGKLIGGEFKIVEISGENDMYKAQYVYLTSDKDSACQIVASLRGTSFEKPRVINTMEDISKINEIVRFNTFFNKNNWENPTDSIIINYNGYFELSPNIYPKPDSVSLSSFYYWDKNKIQYIFKNNLVFHAKFPDMENIQEAKVFILSLIITMLIGLLGNILYRMGIYKIWDYKYLSYIVTSIIVSLALYFCYILFVNARVNTSEVQEKVTAPYYDNNFNKLIE